MPNRCVEPSQPKIEVSELSQTGVEFNARDLGSLTGCTDQEPAGAARWIEDTLAGLQLEKRE